MKSDEDPYRSEELLENATWMRELARSLVRDDSAAEDVVQETMLAVMERPPADMETPAPWLRRVVRNLSLRRRREEARRRRREASTARPERIRETPESLLERAELHREIVEAVISLEEPYRSAILHRYFEDRTAQEIARLEGIPAATVRTHLRRGLERLRRELDALHGDRGSWSAALLPLAGWSFPGTGGQLPMAGAGGAGTGTGGAAVGGVSSTAGAGGAGAASGSSALSLVLLGGVTVSQKTALVVGLIGLVAIAGFGVGRSTAPKPSDEELARITLERPEYQALKKARGALEIEAEKLRDESARAASEKDELAAQLAAAQAKLEKSEALAAARSEPETQGKALPVSFGKYAGLEGLVNADWKEMAEAVENMNSIMLELHALKKGEAPDAETMQRLQTENGKLVRLAAAVMGKVPTSVTGNGEFTHPIVLANLLGAVLERAETPLTLEQSRKISGIGGEYEAEYDRLQTGYSNSTPAQEKMLDELELKRDTMKKIEGTLTPEQSQAAYQPEVRDHSGDVLSPRLMAPYGLLIQPVTGETADGARQAFEKKISEGLKIDPASLPGLTDAFDVWYREVEPILKARPEEKEPSLDDLIRAGRAQKLFSKKLLETPGLSEESRKRVINSQGWYVPLVKAKSEGKDE